MRLAAVDIGTNTVRLLVADVEGADLRDVVREQTITRLGQRVDADRRLDPAAMERTLEAVAAFVSRAQGIGAQALRVAGTSALRDADDRETFVSALASSTGAELELLRGLDEARLSLLGATYGLPAAGHVVCDIGGGSTEIATERAAVSVDVGSVRLKERFLREDPASPDQVAAARAFVTRLFADLSDSERAGSLIGVAGTVTTLAAVVLGCDDYDPGRVHHTRIARADVERWSDRLLAMTTDEVVALRCVERGRADVLASGVLILRCVMERWDHREVLVSVRDILDGLVLDLAQRLA